MYVWGISINPRAKCRTKKVAAGFSPKSRRSCYKKHLISWYIGQISHSCRKVWILLNYIKPKMWWVKFCGSDATNHIWVKQKQFWQILVLVKNWGWRQTKVSCLQEGRARESRSLEIKFSSTVQIALNRLYTENGGKKKYSHSEDRI